MGLPLVDLLVVQRRLHPDALLFVLVLQKDLLSVVDHEVERAQILNLLLQVGDAILINSVFFVTEMRVQVVARCQHELDPLILFILLVAVD